MKHVGTVTLETERLTLRKYMIDDAYEYACVDSENGEVLWEAPFSDEQTSELQKVIDRYANDDFYYWAIVEKASGKIIGGILTIGANERMHSCEMAYGINAKFRNNGYASEALKRVLAFLLVDVEYNRIQAGHLADNPASGRVMEKAGMKYEGTLRQDNRNHDGVLTDSKVYGILREDLLPKPNQRRYDAPGGQAPHGTAKVKISDAGKQKLILITGSPCVGKTSVAESLFESYENCAHFDGDWAWRVHPFSIEDPRLRNGDKTMSFALSTYLNSDFDTVIFSSVVVIGEATRAAILSDITAKGFKTIAFTLKCSEETLVERHRHRGDTTEVSFQWLRWKPHPGDYVIDTDHKTVAQIVDEMKSIIG